MKYPFIISMLVIFLLPLSAVQANEDWRGADAAKAQKTCVYRYLACRDNCDYHQHAEQIRPCKAKCNRTFSCRPNKLKRPASSLYDVN